MALYNLDDVDSVSLAFSNIWNSVVVVLGHKAFSIPMGR